MGLARNQHSNGLVTWEEDGNLQGICMHADKAERTHMGVDYHPETGCISASVTTTAEGYADTTLFLTPAQARQLMNGLRTALRHHKRDNPTP